MNATKLLMQFAEALDAASKDSDPTIVVVSIDGKELDTATYEIEIKKQFGTVVIEITTL